ncbi:hypothetical protein H2200_012873 [Cladophialophora chaetospira]|uniref:Heterokaryon incompatibility domain-containing protein n=1 Tax=Cladophialophora chaetospira TaxID=386627 RepID=A0AA38WWZ8_9EURO|nr:hypothetical protein H2200_012873 [Cladophialophora chaetospira]
MASDEAMNDALREAFSTLWLSDENASINTVRAKAEQKLHLKDGFLKTGSWKSKSKSLIEAEIDGYIALEGVDEAAVADASGSLPSTQSANERKKEKTPKKAKAQPPSSQDRSQSSSGESDDFDHFLSPANPVFHASQKYDPLDVDQREIRLVELLRGTGDDPISCEIQENTPLEDVAGRYIALSYCAGDPNSTTEINLNGVVFNVFAGLGEALRRIRRDKEFIPGMKHLVWVDQICINQTDAEEKSHQVMLMKDIYHNSGRVMVWLGPDEGDRGLGFLVHHYENVKEMIDAVTSKSDDEEKQNGGNDVDGAEDSPEGILDYATAAYASIFPRYIDDEEFVENWQSLGGFASSNYWDRGWICQEIIVARSAALMFGADAMDWKDFCTVWRVVRKATNNFLQAILDDKSLINGPLVKMLKNCGLPQFVRINFLLDMQEAWHKDSSQNIRRMLEAARSCQVTDPRDRVYAFLGLVDSGYSIEPDYKSSNSLQDLFCYTCKRTILFEQSLDILSHAQDKYRTEDDGLPSWVPDWSHERQMPMLQTMDTHFEASGEFKAAAEFRKDSDRKSGRVLRVQCLVIDQLAHEDSLSPGSSEDSGKTLDKWSRLLLSEVGDLEDYVQPLAEVFWRGDGGERESGEAEANDKTGQVKTRNQQVKNHRKVLLDESAGGNWSFFISPNGFFGLASSRARYTDKIVVLLGASVPFVLRQVGKKYLLVGEVYVHGLMNGEAVTMLQQGKVSVKTIDII